MIQIRTKMFETNSSSTMTFAVSICQVENLDIPPKVNIESSDAWWKNDLNGCYALAKRDNQETEFLGLLKYVGVKDIYIDGKSVEADENNRYITFARKETILAKCFGDFKNYSEWQGHGDEWDNSQYLTKEQVKNVQTLLKDPNYIVICIDGDGNEIAWESTHYSKMVITDEEIEAEREYLENKARYDKEMESQYEDFESKPEPNLEEVDTDWEDEDFYIFKRNRYKKKKYK